VSVSTSRPMADSETSADELAFEDEEVSASFSKRAREETPNHYRRKAGRGRALGSGKSQSTNQVQ
jgi:hypothetical protein